MATVRPGNEGLWAELFLAEIMAEISVPREAKQGIGTTGRSTTHEIGQTSVETAPL
jgi:hypothetical protein